MGFGFANGHIDPFQLICRLTYYVDRLSYYSQAATLSPPNRGSTWPKTRACGCWKRTARLLRQRGYHGTSLNDILAASGAPRGSLYFHFPGGKDQLVIEVTKNSVEQVKLSLAEALAAEKSPGAAIRRIFETTARMLQENDFVRGCPVAPVVLDGTTDVPELIELSRQAFEQWIGVFQEFIHQGGNPGATSTCAGAVGGILARRADDYCARQS